MTFSNPPTPLKYGKFHTFFFNPSLRKYPHYSRQGQSVSVTEGRLCWSLLCWSLWPRADVWNCVSHTNDNLNTAVNKTVLHCIIYCCYYSHYSLLFVLKCNFPVIAAPTHYDYDTSRTAVSALLESYNDVSQSSHFSPLYGYSDQSILELICPPNGGKKTKNLPFHHLMSTPSPCLSLLQEEQYFPLHCANPQSNEEM